MEYSAHWWLPVGEVIWTDRFDMQQWFGWISGDDGAEWALHLHRGRTGRHLPPNAWWNYREHTLRTEPAFEHLKDSTLAEQLPERLPKGALVLQPQHRAILDAAAAEL